MATKCHGFVRCPVSPFSTPRLHGADLARPGSGILNMSVGDGGGGSGGGECCPRQACLALTSLKGILQLTGPLKGSLSASVSEPVENLIRSLVRTLRAVPACIQTAGQGFSPIWKQYLDINGQQSESYWSGLLNEPPWLCLERRPILVIHCSSSSAFGSLSISLQHILFLFLSLSLLSPF